MTIWIIEQGQPVEIDLDDGISTFASARARSDDDRIYSCEGTARALHRPEKKA